MSAKEQIQEMLAQGLKPTEVANVIGVDPSYISQLMSDEDFARVVEEKRIEAVAEDIEYDNKIDEVESTFLGNIERKAGLANLQQSLQAFSVLNKAKRRRDSSGHRAAPQIGTVVNIQVNNTILPQYVMNGKSEIVEVEGKTMVSATPTKLDEILAARQGRLPGTKMPQLPGITKVERAAGVLEILDNKPARKLPKLIASDANLSDIL
jgi:transcriptional regulator with XRE-family HTH domain